VLPRSSGEIFEVGPDLLDAVEWMCASGKLTRPFPERIFEPFDSRKEMRCARKMAAPAETLDETVAALQKWADGRKLAKIGQKDLAEWLARREEPFYGVGRKEAQKDKIKVVLKNQSLTFRPEKYWDPQVVTTFTLIDTETGCHLGEYVSFAQLDGQVKGSGEALMYPQAVALAENWLGLSLD
jgi:hypothetical protein